jgi:hypothetical protein
MRLLLVQLFLTIFIYLPGPAAYSCDFCLAGQGLNPYLTANVQGLTLQSTYIESSKAYDHTKAIETNGKKEAWLVNTLTGFISPRPDLTLLLAMPYVIKTNIDYDQTSQLNPGVLVTGLGDIGITARYTFWTEHALDHTWLLGVLAGLKAPTGATTQRDRNGEPVDRHALPGTGSFDETLGLSGSFTSADGFRVTGDVVFNHSGVGRWASRDHQFGDAVNMTARGFYRLGNTGSEGASLALFTGPTFTWTGREKGALLGENYSPSVVNDSTGGKVLFWDLGLYSVLSPLSVASFSFSKAIYHDMNQSADFDADPAEDYKLDLGITFLF